MKIPIKRISICLFTAFSLYFWVLIPIVRVCLTPTLGQDTAESVTKSMTIFYPVDVFCTRVIPTDIRGCVLYYISRSSELFVFLLSFLVIYCFRKVHKKLLIIVGVLLVVLSSYSAASFLNDLFGGLISGVAALSGILTAIYCPSKCISQ